jgi:PAS domain S-box-containing protein
MERRMDTAGVRSPIGVGTEGELASDGLLGLRATIDLAPIGLAQFDHEGRFLLANDRLCEILGCARTDLLARTFQEITFPEDLVRCLELTGRLAANEIPSYCVDKRFVRPDGSIVWTRITVSAVRRTDGTVAFFIGAAEDITKQVEATEALRTTEERLATALEASQIGTFRFDVRRNVLEWADGLERVFGSSQNITLDQFFEVIHPDDRATVMAAYTKSVAEGVDFEENFRVIWPDGSTHWLHDRGRMILGADGTPHYIIGAITDISNHKRMEQVLHEREAQFSTLANTIPQMAWIANSDGTRSWCNDRWLEYTGARLDDACGFGWMRAHESHGAAQEVLASQRAAFHLGSAWERTVCLRRKDGAYRWFLSRAMPVRERDGHIKQWVGTNTDITDRLDQEQRLRRALDVENIGVIFFDNEHRVTAINNAFARMSGYTPAAVTDRLILWRDLAPSDDPVRGDARATEFDATGRTTPDELEFTRKDGTRWWGLVTATRVSETEGVKFVLDITDRKNTERDRMEMLAREQTARQQAEQATNLRQQVLGIVAHDLRNPLQAIVMAASALLELPMSPEQRTKRLEVIKRCARDMDRLIADLLDVSRIQAGTFEVRRDQVHVPKLISDVLESFEGQAAAGDVRLVADFADSPESLDGDAQRLAQVLSNLVNNAIKFTPAGGQVRIGTRRDGTDLEIIVDDTGCGIAPEHVTSIFDRFWQADRTSGGAGLGLAIVKGIVDSHRGHIHVDSAPGRGATFRVRLPCPAETVPQSEGQAASG